MDLKQLSLPKGAHEAWLRGMILRCWVRWVLACLWGVASAKAAIPEAATPQRLCEWPAISPDGKRIVYEWLGDLWSAAVEGGESIRLTGHPAPDSRPRFTPDGQRVVFSSMRGGSYQVFSMAAGGGEPVQHSDHSEGGLLECLAPDGKHAMISGTREATGQRASRLLAVDLSGESRERRVFDAYATAAACSPDGTRILFCRGGDRPYRHGTADARASQLWLYDCSSKSFARMLPAAMDVRSPVWHRDGKGFYYIASSNGVANLWSYDAIAGSSKQLTFLHDDGVNRVSVSADDSIFILQCGWQLCRYRPATDAAPVPLELWTRAKLPDVSRVIDQVNGTTDADFTPMLDQVVFSALGELWWMAAGNNPPVRLTTTAAAESEVHLTRDGSWLYFLRDDGLEANYYRATIDKDRRLGEAHPLTHGRRSKCRLKLSPDEAKIAWVEGTGDVCTAAADGSNPRQVFQCWDKPGIEWSPCGRWLALAANDKNSNRDIWLTAADGSRAALDLTRHPARESSPRWSPDGRFLVFSAHRGESGKASLWRVDFGKTGLTPDMPDAVISRLGDLAAPLTTSGIEPSHVLWAGDSKSLLLQNAEASRPQLYSLTINEPVLTPVAQHGGVPLRVTPEGSLLWRVGGCPAILKKNGELTRFPIAMAVERRREDVLRLGFRRIWRTLGERFHDPAMTGTDWPALREKYEPLAVASRDSGQFDRIVALMLEKLHSSHLGFVSDVWPPANCEPQAAEASAHPGLVFGDDAGDGPLVIARVLSGSPVATLEQAPRPGEIVTRIAGEDVSTGSPLQRFFQGAIDRPIPMMLRAADGRERVIELRGIAYARARALAHQTEEARYAAIASDPPAPRVIYLPLPDMLAESIQQLELEIYRASLECAGLILDLRDTGGGTTADRLLAVFSQPNHAFTIPRDGPPGYPIERRGHPVWNQPVVILCNENTCSNAEIFCHAMQQTGRAVLIGSPTAGCVVSAVDEVIPDLGHLQVPFRGWFDVTTGENLDAQGVVPDHTVELGPAAEAAGQDPQFQRALAVLRATLAKAPRPVEARRNR